MEAIQKYCAANNHVLIGIYADEAKSGFNTERDNFQRMIQDAEAQVFEAIVFYDLSRISRNVVDWFTARERFRQMDVKLLSCTETIGEADDPASFLSESMKAIISQHFVMETRKKVIAGQTSKAKQGVFLGGIPPLGYDIVDGRYVINNYEAGAVRLMFELYAEGYGYKYISRVLKEKGYKSKRGGVIGVNAARSILQNERYNGTYCWNRVKTKYFGKWAGGELNPDVVRIEDGCPAIIEKKLWDEVVRRMKSKSRARVKSEGMKFDYLLSGLIRCDKCGASFCGNYKKNTRGYINRYYTCTGKLNRKGCKAKPMNADELEVLVVALLKDEFFNSNLIDRTADLITEKVNSGAKSKSQKIGDIKKEISDIDMKKSNLIKVLMDGFDSQSVRDKVAELERERGLLDQSLDVMNITKDDTIDREVLVKQLKRDSFALHNEPDKIKDILRKYISKIIISDDMIEITSFTDVVSVGNSGEGKPPILTIIYNCITCEASVKW